MSTSIANAKIPAAVSSPATSRSLTATWLKSLALRIESWALVVSSALAVSHALEFATPAEQRRLLAEWQRSMQRPTAED